MIDVLFNKRINWVFGKPRSCFYLLKIYINNEQNFVRYDEISNYFIYIEHAQTRGSFGEFFPINILQSRHSSNSSKLCHWVWLRRIT